MYLHHFLFHTYAKSGSKCGNQRTPAAKIQHLYRRAGERGRERRRGAGCQRHMLICACTRRSRWTRADCDLCGARKLLCACPERGAHGRGVYLYAPISFRSYTCNNRASCAFYLISRCYLARTLWLIVSAGCRWKEGKCCGVDVNEAGVS